MVEEIIDFKSIGEFFYDEKKGLKNNTIRRIDFTEEKFQILLRAWKSKNYPLIRINLVDLVHCSEDKALSCDKDEMYSFMRKVKHIAIYLDWMIITWKHIDKDMVIVDKNYLTGLVDINKVANQMLVFELCSECKKQKSRGIVCPHCGSYGV